MLSAALVIAGLGFAVRLSAQIDRDADRLKSEFVGTASHELRTPLTTLQMGIDLLDEQVDAARHRAAARNSGDVPRGRGPTWNAWSTTCSTCRRSSPGACSPSSRASMQVRCEGRTGAQPTPHRGERHRASGQDRSESPAGDGGSFSDGAGVRQPHCQRRQRDTAGRPYSWLTAHRTYDRVEVSVSDTGRGIPKEYLPRLFGKFVQVPGGATGSAGLGLAISRQIVRAHGGDMRAASEPGKGATFTFTLPVAGSPAEHPKET